MRRARSGHLCFTIPRPCFCPPPPLTTAGAWSTRHTLPRAMCATAEQQWSKQVCHSPPPPPRHTRAHTHRHGGISRPRAPLRGLGAVNSPAGLVTGHPGTAAQSGPAGKAARTVGRRPGEALTQPNPTQPNPPSPNNLENLLAASKILAHPLHPVYDDAKGGGWEWWE